MGHTLLAASPSINLISQDQKLTFRFDQRSIAHHFCRTEARRHAIFVHLHLLPPSRPHHEQSPPLSVMSLFRFLVLVFPLSLACAHDPLAKCTSFPPTSSPPPPPSPSSLRDLLGGLDAVHNFFSTSFERAHLHVRESSREDRRDWQHIYRRFVLLNDVDALLSRNASALRPGNPLALHEDVDLIRPGQDESGVWTRQSVDTLFPSAKGPTRNAIDMASVHQAFRDGFELVLHAMHHRSQALADLVDGLSAFWLVQVTASLHLSPPRASKYADKHAPQIYAGDVFLVQLDGQQSVRLFPDLFPFPAARHLADLDVQAVVQDTLQEHKGPDTLVMEPGDVLYVPRGSGVDALPTGPLSLHVALEVATHTSSLDDGIRAALDAVREPMPDNPLYAPLEEDTALPGHAAAWIDLLHASVRVAAEFTPQLRRFLPLGSVVSEVIEDAGGASVVEMVAEQVQRFAAAATDALFAPVVEVLAERGDAEERVRLLASESVIEWTRRLVSETTSDEERQDAMQQSERIFKVCVKALEESRQAPFDGVTSLQLEALESERVERPRLLRVRDEALKWHGVGGKNETAGSERGTCGDGGGGSCRA